MKKIVSVLIAVVMLAAALSAFAVTEINWADMQEAGAELIAQGEMIGFDEAGVNIWIPSAMSSEEIDEDIRSQGFLGYYYLEDGSGAISIREAAQDMTLEEYKAAAEAGGALDMEDVVINGMNAFSYTDAEYGILFTIYETPSGFLLEVNGYSGVEDFTAIVQFTMASVTPV